MKKIIAKSNTIVSDQNGEEDPGPFCNSNILINVQEVSQ